jgi:DNA-binding NarL/FixJ family response regulator
MQVHKERVEPVSPHYGLVSRDHIAKLRQECSALTRKRHHLLENMRSAVETMRTLRSRLARNFEPQISRSPVRAHVGGTLRQELSDVRQRYHLTPREWEVAVLLADGRSNVEVAAALGISAHTARHHTESVLAKLGVRSRAQAGAILRGSIAELAVG